VKFETMPIFFQQDIDENSRLAIWKIEEDESFFLPFVPLQRDITHPHKRLQHLAGRYLLKYLFPAFPTELIKIADTRKPFLESEAYHFSISHCADFAAVIVSSNNRVGIDIEVPGEKVLRIQHKFLHPDEMQMISEVAEGSLLPAIFWSCKEAMFKWWGRGGIDFSEMLRLSESDRAAEFFQGTFIKGSFKTVFPVHYKLFHRLVLSWVITDPEQGRDLQS
jgi:4'-phosphopantetheinyl transferase EntD